MFDEFGPRGAEDEREGFWTDLSEVPDEQHRDEDEPTFSIKLEKTRIFACETLRFVHFASRILFFSGAEQNSATGQRSHSGRRALQQ